MSIIRWSPSRSFAWSPVSGVAPELNAFQQEIDRLFGGSHKDGGAEDNGEVSTYLPAVDIVEHDDEFVVKADLPGVVKDDVKITVTNDILTIRGEKKQVKDEKKANEHRIERVYGTFQRSFSLPKSVSSDKIEATFTDGVLTVKLPKMEEAKPKQVEIKVK
jgi:HSP20 family protein